MPDRDVHETITKIRRHIEIALEGSEPPLTKTLAQLLSIVNDLDELLKEVYD